MGTGKENLVLERSVHLLPINFMARSVVGLFPDQFFRVSYGAPEVTTELIAKPLEENPFSQQNQFEFLFVRALNAYCFWMVCILVFDSVALDMKVGEFYFIFPELVTQ